jgi:hypothetical protein
MGCQDSRQLETAPATITCPPPGTALAHDPAFRGAGCKLHVDIN